VQSFFEDPNGCKEMKITRFGKHQMRFPNFELTEGMCTLQAKFLALLILVPWVIDFLVHDYVMMPFLER
jgi:hypothetical protein